MDLREATTTTVNRHPWELARVTALSEIALAYGILSPGVRVLDLGCGDGFLIETLCPALTGPIDALDIHLTAEQLATFAAERPRLAFHNSYQHLASKAYGLITLFDVLEHVDRDADFLRETITRFAAPGARIFCTVPAFHSLFSAHDTFLKHHRRYSLLDLRQLLEGSGLRVIASGYLFGLLLPVRVLTVLAEKLLPAGDAVQGIGHWRQGRLITTLVKAMLELDNRLLIWLTKQGITLPGLTAWALCER